MISHTLLLLTLAFPAQASYTWDYFADKFATDLAPIIVLFGEQVTKQFLSESTTILDNIIFAVAPLGVITAIVSVIRVHGDASLKAFIGRAQEAHGVAEAELCSSTSRDVCELWSNGGISRVFGRPKIIEFVFSGESDFYPKFASGGRSKHAKYPACGIRKAASFFNCGPEDTDPASWEEVGVDGSIQKQASEDQQRFAPYPNLSLNIGIRPFPRLLRAHWLAAGVGIMLQSSFFIFAAWATYYAKHLWEDGRPPEQWTFPVAATGTGFLVVGMFTCALLIERSTLERRYKKNGKNVSWPSLVPSRPEI
jgi:hypothetical protein